MLGVPSGHGGCLPEERRRGMKRREAAKVKKNRKTNKYNARDECFASDCW